MFTSLDSKWSDCLATESPRRNFSPFHKRSSPAMKDSYRDYRMEVECKRFSYPLIHPRNFAVPWNQKTFLLSWTFPSSLESSQLSSDALRDHSEHLTPAATIIFRFYQPAWRREISTLAFERLSPICPKNVQKVASNVIAFMCWQYVTMSLILTYFKHVSILPVRSIIRLIEIL